MSLAAVRTCPSVPRFHLPLLAVVWLALFVTAAAQGAQTEANRVLEIAGSGDYLEMGEKGPVIGVPFTVEAAVFVLEDLEDRHFGVLGGAKDVTRLNLGLERPPSIYLNHRTGLHGGYGDGTTWLNWDADDVLAPGAWNHIALVADGKEQRLYVNGTEVVREPATTPPLQTPLRWIGRTSSPFRGSIDEVRVWSVVRTAEQVKDARLQRLTGREEGLTALWNFDDAEKPGRDATGHGFDGVMQGNARTLVEAVDLSAASTQSVLCAVTGTVTDENGQPAAGVSVAVLGARGAKFVAVTDAAGAFSVSPTLRQSPVRVLATLNDAVAELREVALAGERIPPLSLRLVRPAAVSGRVLDTDGRAQSGVIVEAVQEKSVRRAVTGSDGAFLLADVPPGDYQVRAQADGGAVLFNEGKPLTVKSGDKLTADLHRAPRTARAPVPAAGGVLQLDGQSGRVLLPDGMLAGMETLTFEFRVRWQELDALGAVLGFGDANRTFLIGPLTVTSDLGVVMNHGEGFATRVVAPGVLRAGEWVHVAVVAEGVEATVYVNGVAAAAGNMFQPPRKVGEGPGQIGSSPWRGNTWLHGAVDEVRLWAVRRSPQQISEQMRADLRGDEDGLLALWNFNDPAQPGREATPRAWHGTAEGGATVAPAEVIAENALPPPTVLSGVVTDPDGRVLSGAEVRLTSGGVALPPAFSDQHGEWLSTVPAGAAEISVWAAKGDFACAPRSIALKPGANTADLTLRDSASISGRTLALDDSPLPNIVVQAVSNDSGGLRRGLLGEFFAISGLNEFPASARNPVLRRAEENFSFPLANDSIGGQSMDAGFYVRWSGKLRTAAAGRYEFHLAANDRARLTINGAELLDSKAELNGTRPLADSAKTAALDLTAGEHDILVEYINRIGREGMELGWTPPGGKREIIPPTVLNHTAPADQLIITTMSDERGGYRFPELSPGDYVVRAQVPGGHALINSGRPVTVKRNEPKPAMNFRLAPFKKGVWRRYNYNDGLASDSVNSISLAPDGALWIATQGGASRFDGMTFQNWTAADGLAANNVYSVHADADGTLWFGTMGGLTRRDPQAGTFQTFRRTDGLAGTLVKAMLRDRAGTLWFACDEGLSRWQAGKMETVLTLDKPTPHGAGLCEDAAGDVWWGGDGAVWRVHGGVAENFAAAKLEGMGTVNAVCEGEPGVMWIGATSGLTRCHTKTGEVKHFTPADGLTGVPVTALQRDSRGRIWIGTFKDSGATGVSCYDRGSFITYRRADGLPDELVPCITSDGDGALWFATYRGIAGLDTDLLTHWSLPDGIDSGDVNQITSTRDGAVWILTEGKLARYDGRKFTKMTQANGLPVTRVESLTVDRDGALLALTGEAVIARLEPGRGEVPAFEVMPDSPANARHAARATTGEMWYANNEGVWHEGEAGPAGAGKIGQVQAIRPASGGVMWFQLAQDGMARWEGGKIQKFNLRGGAPFGLE